MQERLARASSASCRAGPSIRWRQDLFVGVVGQQEAVMLQQLEVGVAAVAQEDLLAPGVRPASFHNILRR